MPSICSMAGPGTRRTSPRSDDGQAGAAAGGPPLLGQVICLRPADFQEAAGLFDGEERRDPIVHGHSPQALTTQSGDGTTVQHAGTVAPQTIDNVGVAFMPRRRREKPPEPGSRPGPSTRAPRLTSTRSSPSTSGPPGSYGDGAQEEFAERLERYLGTRLTQASVSAIERAWDGDRRREFDAHELLIFAMVFDLPMIWFLLPPKGDHRLMRGTTRQVDELYLWLLGRPEKLEPLYDRLREYGIHDPSENELIVEKPPASPPPPERGAPRNAARRCSSPSSTTTPTSSTAPSRNSASGSTTSAKPASRLHRRTHLGRRLHPPQRDRRRGPGRDGTRQHPGRDGTRRYTEAPAARELIGGGGDREAAHTKRRCPV